jgi:hypothetical protein
MSLRSGVFTKYVIEFVDAQFKVSNDASAGDFLIDADVTVTMARGTGGTTFTITLYNLPQKQVDLLHDALQPKTYRSLKIQLGYFETGVQPVVVGVYNKVESRVAADSSSGQNKLVTTISGKESALVACTDAKFSCSLSEDHAETYAKAAQAVLSGVFSAENKKAHPGIDGLVNQTIQPVPSKLPATKSDTRFNNNTVLTILGELADNKQANAELLVSDGKVFLDSPITRSDVAAAQLDPSINLAAIGKLKLALKPKTTGASRADPPKETSVTGFTFTVLGDPTMRPGQTIVVSEVKGIASPPNFCIRGVTHKFSASTGYVCDGDAAEVLADGAAGRDIDSQIRSTAAGAATDVASAIKSEAAKNPIVEVTLVKSASDKDKYPYQADLYYGQARNDEQQPSIEVAIATRDDCHTYLHRPIAAPFAWRKCGLVTPVYPTMKALVAHNFGLATDGIVTGYMWSGKPDFPPPPNQPGDWWLSLPIDVDAASLPPDQTPPPPADQTATTKTDAWVTFDWTKFDQTKAVNDLTGPTGKRVIEIKGLKITIGAGKLAAVGTRPIEGPDDDFLIEHATGASVHIDSNGALTIDAGKASLAINASGTSMQIDTNGALTINASKASLTIKGNVVIEGSLEIK